MAYQGKLRHSQAHRGDCYLQRTANFIRSEGSFKLDLTADFIRTSRLKKTTHEHAVIFEMQPPKVPSWPSYQSKHWSQVLSMLVGPVKLILNRYHLTGWAPEDPLWAVQAGEYKKYLSAYQALAKELRICLVPGSIVERHQSEAEGKDQFTLYNTAYFISNDGSILGSYRKKNIWHPERPHLTSSGEAPHEVFDTPIGKVGLLICWDLAFPEAFRELIAQGAEVVVIPTFCNIPSSLFLRYAAADSPRDAPRCLARGACIQPRLRSALPRVHADVALLREYLRHCLRQCDGCR